jgi:hypothetical protein
MMKKFWPLVLCLVLLSIGCSKYYTVLKETPPTQSLNSYATLSLGWLDLGEEKAKNYGYKPGSAGDWIAFINEISRFKFPLYVREFLPGKTIRTVKAKSEAPKNEGLMIVFSEVNYLRLIGEGQIAYVGNEKDLLCVTVRFIDAQSGQELAMSKVRISSQGGVSSRYGGFQARVISSAYNLAQFLSEKILSR